MNQTPAFIRTAVPAFVGWLLALLAKNYEIVVDDSTSASLIAGLSGLLGYVYYAIVKVVERRYPGFGILLGSTNQPIYIGPKKVNRAIEVKVTESELDLIPRAEAERMAEEAALEAYRQIEVGGSE